MTCTTIPWIYCSVCNWAAAFPSLGIPTFACMPAKFPEPMAAAYSRRDAHEWEAMEGMVLSREKAN